MMSKIILPDNYKLPEKEKTSVFLIFGFNAYYPKGGLNDFITIANSEEEAAQMIIKWLSDEKNDNCFDTYQVIDTSTGKYKQYYSEGGVNEFQLTNRDI